MMKCIIRRTLLCICAMVAGFNFATGAENPNIGLIDPAVIANTQDNRMSGRIENISICPTDSNFIAFELSDETRTYLYIHDRRHPDEYMSFPPASRSIAALARPDTTSGSLEWYPGRRGDGAWFVFISNAGASGASQRLWLGNATANHAHPLIIKKTDGSSYYEPRFSPDGCVLMFGSNATGGGDLWLMKLAHKYLQIVDSQVVSSGDVELEVSNPNFDHQVNFYPGQNSGYFAYVNSKMVPEGGTSTVEFRIHDMLRSGKGKEADFPVENIEPYFYFSPTWNPDGSGQLAFLYCREYVKGEKQENIRFRLGTARASTLAANKKHSMKDGLRVRIQKSDDDEMSHGTGLSGRLQSSSLSWTPDGRYILAPSGESDVKSLYFYEPRVMLDMGYSSRSEDPFLPQYKFPSDVSLVGSYIAFKYITEYQEILYGRLEGSDFGPRVTRPEDFKLASDDRKDEYLNRFYRERGFVDKAVSWVGTPLFHPNLGINTKGGGLAIAAGAIIYVLTRDDNKPTYEFKPPILDPLDRD